MLSTMEVSGSGGFSEIHGLICVYLLPGLDAAGLAIEGLGLELGDDPTAAAQTT